MPAWLNVTFDTGILKFEGQLTSAEMRDRFMQNMAEKFGSDNVIDATKINSDIKSADWLQSLAQWIPDVHNTVNNGSLVIKDGMVHLHGEVPDIQSIERLVGECRNVFPEMVIDNNLQVAAANRTTDSGENLNPRLEIKHIEFDLNSTALSVQARDQLDELIRFLETYPKLILEISGHTDSSGDPAYNLQLSRQRAEAVAQYLNQKGIQDGRMKIVMHGAQVPAADNITVSGRQQNRRVEFHILQ
jgi:OOP family OmpA-OmpF porin